MTRIEDRIDQTTDNDGKTSSDVRTEPTKKAATTPARRKLTGAELEALFDGWRNLHQTTRTARTARARSRTLRRTLGAAIGAAIATLVVASAVTGATFAAARSGDEARIASLEAQAAAAQAQPADARLAEKTMKLAAAATADAGTVRDAQQAYATLYHKASTQPGTDNGAPNEAMAETAAHRRVLAPLFDKDSYLADDQDAYTWQNVLPFDPGSQIDPRFAWYIRYDGLEASDPGEYAWKVETVTPDRSAQHAATATAKIVWLCRETTTGDVLAWANAVYTYDGRHGAFDDLDVVVTLAGAEHENPVSTAGSGSDMPEPGGSAPDTQSNTGGGR